MWALMIEVGAPFQHQIACMAQGVEQMFIQQFVTHATVKAFYKAVLHRCPAGKRSAAERWGLPGAM